MTIVPESVEYHIPGLPVHVLMIFATWAVLIALSVAARMTASRVPKGLSGAFELLFGFIFNFADTAIGEKAKRFYPLFIGIFMFVLTGNLIGLIPGFISPTSNLSVTLGLALITFCFYHYQGLREHGLAYFKQFMGPKLPWYMFPVNMLMFVVEIVSHLARVISLSLRLFCNIFAKELLLGILAVLILSFWAGPGIVSKGLTGTVFVLRPLIILLGFLVSFIQAFIFSALAVVYVAGAVSEGH